MGWQNAHLPEFVIRGVRYGEPVPDEPKYQVEPERTLTLRAAAPTEGMHFEYLYDFGDGWRHDILVEKIEVPAEPLRHPVCLAGERACPPEDCGGPHGYMELVEILRDPDHEEYEERLEWAGGSFDSRDLQPRCREPQAPCDEAIVAMGQQRLRLADALVEATRGVGPTWSHTAA